MEAVRRELASGVSPNATSFQGNTPLNLLCQHRWDGAGRLAACRLLIEAGADPNISDETGLRWAALHSAAAYGCVKLLAPLLEAGADVNKLSLHNSSPLHLACEYGGCPESIVVLVRAGAALNGRNDDGLTPLDLVDWHVDTVSIVSTRRGRVTLLRAGAEISAHALESSAYLQKVQAAGGFQKYERSHLNALVGIFAPKFSRLLPPELVRRVLEFAYPVGEH